MSATVPEVPDVMKLDLSVGSLHVVDVDGDPYIVLRPAIESLGLDYPTQLRKLKNRSWSVVGSRPTTGSDGKTYEMTVVPVHAFLMLLATVNENRVFEEQRPTLVAFQRETAKAVEKYWIHGGVINPRATGTQRADMMNRLQTLEDFHHHIVEEGRDFSVREAAAFINRDHDLTTGQNMLFELLRKWGMIDHRNRPYAKHKAHVVWSLGGEYRDQYGELRIGASQVRVTVTGLLYIHTRLRRELA